MYMYYVYTYSIYTIQFCFVYFTRTVHIILQLAFVSQHCFSEAYPRRFIKRSSSFLLPRCSIIEHILHLIYSFSFLRNLHFPNVFQLQVTLQYIPSTSLWNISVYIDSGKDMPLPKVHGRLLQPQDLCNWVPISYTLANRSL